MGGFSDRLLAILEGRHISQYRLAKDLNIKVQTVSGWIHAGRIPRQKTMEQVATYLNVSPAFLQFGDLHHVPTVRSDMERLCEQICAIADKNPNSFRRLKKLLQYYVVMMQEEEAEREAEALKIIDLAVSEKLMKKKEANRLIKKYHEEEEEAHIKD